MPDDQSRTLAFTVDDVEVEAPDVGDTLLGVLRDHLGLIGAKDGCSPQGQCGCCTVLVDGQPRVACVTPARRIKGRSVTTIDGFDPERATRWSTAMCATGGSQCGFCTPGIVLRLDGVVERPKVDQALLAHLCRCTGWQTIREAWDLVADVSITTDAMLAGRDLEAAARRAEIEGGTPQRVDPSVALGRGGFSADRFVDEFDRASGLVAVSDGNHGWVVGETLAEARELAGKTQGRRTTVDHSWPIDLPEGPWEQTMRTTWVEPAYLETDASWCLPGGDPSTPLANGGAFGAKLDTPVTTAARRLADQHDRPVLVLGSREDTVRWGVKRPPLAAGVRADGTGMVRVARTQGIAAAINAVAPGLEIQEIGIHGPPTSSSVRAAGWAEAAVLMAGLAGEAAPVTSPSGAVASASIKDGRIHVVVRCGDPLDDVILRSYCIGAAHMAWSWLTSEALTVDDDGEVHDLTVRSFGVLRAVDTPPIDVTIEPDDGPPLNGSDAVFAAVAAAGWLASGCRQDWPVGAIIAP